MKILNNEKCFRTIVCNLVIVCLIAVFGGLCVYETKNKTIQTANSEYNGTIYAGDKTSKNVSLMVNVYWGNEHLKKMLETFDKHNIKTTFFVGGSWAKENAELLKKISEAGHEIASHGTNHKEHAKISYEDNLTEIQTCHEIVKLLTSKNMELFAPPGGSYNKNTTKAAEFLGYKTIMWTRDTIDWRDKDANLIYNRAVTNLCGGDLILMHPTECTAEALPKIIDHIIQKGYTVCPVSDTLGLSNKA